MAQKKNLQTSYDKIMQIKDFINKESSILKTSTEVNKRLEISRSL